MSSTNLDILINARDQASSVINGVRSSGSRLGSQLGKTTTLSDRFHSAGTKAMNGFKSAAKGAAIVGGAAVVAVGVKGVAAASDLNESMSKVDVVFGKNADSIKSWSEGAAQHLGMSQQAALEAAGTYGNLFSAMGVGAKETKGMSTELIGLSADLASFNNMEPGEVLEKLRAGLVGEAEPLRSLGVNISAATIESKAMEMGFKKVHGELDAGSKAQAAYALIMEQTTTAQGDFARTSDGVANQQRITAATFQDTMAQIGQALLPVIQEIFPVLQDVLKQLAPVFADLMGNLGRVLAALMPVIQPFLEVLMEVITALVDALTPIFDALIPIAEEFAGSIRQILEALTPLLKPIADLVIALLPLLPLAADLIAAMVPLVADVLKPLLQVLLPVVEVLVQLVKDVLPPIQEAFKRAFLGLVSFVAPIIQAVMILIEKCQEAVAWFDRVAGSEVNNAVTKGLEGVFDEVDWSRVVSAKGSDSTVDAGRHGHGSARGGSAGGEGHTHQVRAVNWQGGLFELKQMMADEAHEQHKFAAAHG